MTLTCTASLQRMIQTSDQREMLSGSTAHVVLPLALLESLSVSLGVREVSVAPLQCLALITILLANPLYVVERGLLVGS